MIIKRHEDPWIHYLIENYFDELTLSNLISEIPKLNFKKSIDDYRDEYDFNSSNYNNPLIQSIINSFLSTQNINLLSKQNNNLKEREKILRISIWKDYKGFKLPIHTDSFHKLFTMQIYLPLNSEKDYGTSFYDENNNFYKKSDYILNNGYYFFPNINGIKTNHSFNEDIKTERCSIVFNIFDENLYTKKIKKDINSYIKFK